MDLTAAKEASKAGLTGNPIDLVIRMQFNDFGQGGSGFMESRLDISEDCEPISNFLKSFLITKLAVACVPACNFYITCVKH